MPSLLVVDNVLVGTSGWSYRAWVGPFYPPRTPTSRMLDVYAERLPTVEVHNTFRRRPPATTLESWKASVPAGFRFAVKAHVGITHRRDLNGVEDRVEAFLASLGPLEAHVGPVLFQLPHRQPDLGRLNRLLDAVPPGSAVAFELWPAWRVAPVLDRLDRAGATLVAIDRDDGEAETELPDAGSFAYLRLRRARYDIDALDRWAERLRSLDKPAFVYFRHDGDPEEAVRLQEAVRG